MNNYEGLFIIRPTLNDEEVKGIFKFIGDTVNKTGGSIKKEDSWGKKQLVYPVAKFGEGYYYKVDFEAPAEAIVKLEGACKLNSDLLRVMISRR